MGSMERCFAWLPDTHRGWNLSLDRAPREALAGVAHGWMRVKTGCTVRGKAGQFVGTSRRSSSNQLRTRMIWGDVAGRSEAWL